MIRTLALVALWTASVGANAFTADEFFTHPDVSAAVLSPDGRQVAVIADVENEPAIDVIDTATGARRRLADQITLGASEASPLSLVWIDNETVAVTLVELRAGVENLLDTKGTRRLVMLTEGTNEASTRVASVRTSGRMVGALPESPDEFLYARSGRVSRVYRVRASKLNDDALPRTKLTRIDGGQFVASNAVASVDGFALHWFEGEGGQPHSVLHLGESGALLSVFRDDGKTDKLYEWSADTMDESADDPVFFPLARTRTEDTYFAVDLSDEERRTIFRVNYRTEEVDEIYRAGEYPIFGVTLAPGASDAIGVQELRDGQVTTVYIDEQGVRYQDEADRDGTQQRIRIDRSPDGQHELFYLEDHNAPGRFEVVHNRQSRLVGSEHPNLNARLTSRLETATVDVDGLTVPYLLTLPGREHPQPWPLVVIPHGGPVDVYDDAGFEPTVQFFAANGYAVLRVNFRGSGGFGDTYRDAGKREYGAGMLRDINAAVAAVAARPDINADRIVVAGFSYGGYAASMLGIRHPETYRAAVTLMGVSDLGLFVAQSDWPERAREWGEDYIGDPWTDAASLAEQSPDMLLDQLRVPLMIVHGGKDEVVDIEHAYRLKVRLDQLGKDYEWQIYPETGHNLGDLEDRRDLHRRVLAFLDRYARL
ncbi:MAG: alpha/beta fold hydrolase [Pseudomonadota bacterium]